MMFEKFTERARKVMSVARQEAQRRNSEFIGTEHILLGLLEDGAGIGGTVLKKMNIESKAVRAEIEKLITHSSSPTVTLGQLPFSPRCKRVIELAGEESFRTNADVIHTGHILLALYRENEGIACQVMKNLGMDSDRLRQEINGIEPEDNNAQNAALMMSLGYPDPTQTNLRIRLLQEVPNPETIGPYIVLNGALFKEKQTISLSGISSEKALTMAKAIAEQHGATSYIVEPFERQ